MNGRSRLAALAAAAGGLVLAIGLAAQPVASAAALFADDFEDGVADGWTKSGGSWSVVTDGSRAYQQSGTSSDARALVGGTWADQAVQVRVKPLGFTGSGRHVAVLARARNTSDYYYLALSNTGSVVLGKRTGGTFSTLATAAATVPTGTWQTVRLEAFGTTLLVTATDGTFASGRIGCGELLCRGVVRRRAGDQRAGNR